MITEGVLVVDFHHLLGLCLVLAPATRTVNAAGNGVGFDLTMAQSPHTPLEVLFSEAVVSNPRLSSDGSAVAYLRTTNGATDLWVSRDGNSRQVTSGDGSVSDYQWVDPRHNVLYVESDGRDKVWRLAVAHVPSGERHVLTSSPVPPTILAADPVSERALLLTEESDRRIVWRLDLAHGEGEVICEDLGLSEWVTNRDLSWFGGVRLTPEGCTVLYFDPKGRSWIPIYSLGIEDTVMSIPLRPTYHHNDVYLRSSEGAQGVGIVRLRLDERSVEVVAEKASDVQRWTFQQQGAGLEYVSVLNGRMRNVAMSPSVQSVLDTVSRIDAGDWEVTSTDVTSRRWVVRFERDTGSDVSFIFDRTSQDTQQLFVHRPVLEGYDLAPMEPFSFRARDGLELQGYLTFPLRAERRNLPAVLYVHGGPWDRHTWGFDPEAQWLASQGYACVQLNFRGSTGHGRRVFAAGRQQWGAGMHTDLVDCVRHLERLGYIDPERVGAFGGAYGGYAVLWAAVTEPRIFKCGVDIVGPTNLRTMIEAATAIPKTWLHHLVGRPEELWERSPLSLAHNVQTPLIIFQGRRDPVTRRGETEQFVAALRTNRVDHEYHVYDARHGFETTRNQLDFYRRVELFLGKHLGGNKTQAK